MRVFIIVAVIAALVLLAEVSARKCIKCKSKGKTNSGKQEKKNNDNKAEYDKGDGCGVAVDITKPVVLEENCTAVDKQDKCKTKYMATSYDGDYDVERGCVELNETVVPVATKNETVNVCSTDNCNENLDNVTRCYLCNKFGIGTDECDSSSKYEADIVHYCSGKCKKHRYGMASIHYVIRECDPECKADSSLAGIDSTYCCTGDLCNTASHVALHMMHLVIALFVTISYL